MKNASLRLAIILAIVLVLNTAFQVKAASVSFCEYGENPLLSEKMIIDIDNKMAIGSDTRFTLLPLVNAEVVGFESPFPLVVPKNGKYMDEWVSLNYKYTILNEFESDWIVILASPTEELGNFTKSQTLYSQSEGVITVSVSRTFEDDTYTTTFYRCGLEKFFPEDLLSE